MIDDKTKQKLLKELEKSGNVFLSCLKTGIDRSTYYRWFDADKEFRKMAGQAVRRGRENNCDIAKHALMIKVKEKDMRAIEYVLGHNDPEYRRKQTSNVVIVHKKVNQIIKDELEDPWEKQEQKERENAVMYYHVLIDHYLRKIPNKPDGTPIWLREFPKYYDYIDNWNKLSDAEKERIGISWRKIEIYETRGMSYERLEELIDTVDSGSEKDKSSVALPENQTSSDSSNSTSATPDKPQDNNT